MKQLHGLFAIAKLLDRTTTTQLLYGDAHIDVSTVMKVAWRLLYEASSLLRVYVERNVNGGLQVLLDEDGDSSKTKAGGDKWSDVADAAAALGATRRKSSNSSQCIVLIKL